MSSEPPFGEILLSVWEEYRKAAKRSRALKRRLNRTRLIVLGLVVAGSVLGLSADQSVQWLSREAVLGWLPRGLAAAGAVALAIAAFLGKEVLDSTTEREWVFARSQAEALKSEAYKFMAKAPPYDGDDRERRLSDQAKVLLEDEASAAPVRLDEDDKRRNLPGDWLSVDDYIRDRVEDQIKEYYEPNALETHAILERLRLSGFVLGLVGAVLGAIGASSTSSTWTAGWIAVIGAISGSIAAFAFAGRYQYLSISYELTARRLKMLVHDWRLLAEAEKPGKAGEFVHNCENAISVENHNWIAEWTKKSKKSSS